MKVFEQLAELRTELIELAYTLDLRGQFAAADVAITTSARLAELCEEGGCDHAVDAAMPFIHRV